MNTVSICGRRLVVRNTFADGTMVCTLTAPRRTSENDILAHALWLERHGRAEEASEFLDKWCIANHPATRN
jgi:hypothetical protein